MARLNGKVALVSGGARGLGAAQVRLLVLEGVKVVLGDVLEEDGTALTAELGDNARFVRLDVTQIQDWEAAVTAAVATGAEFVVDGGETAGLAQRAG